MHFTQYCEHYFAEVFVSKCSGMFCSASVFPSGVNIGRTKCKYDVLLSLSLYIKTMLNKIFVLTQWQIGIKCLICLNVLILYI